MKKETFIFSLVLLAGLTLTFIGCGPSRQERAEAEARRLDSLRIDSMIINSTADQKYFEVHGPVKTVVKFRYSSDYHYHSKDSTIWS